ncbi:integral membrane protein [Colletotrichum plurivorum]|uniref:Integral membrane protein n=1 Tax=Colletotrichum plurivorum TaxID=2175906 RepID=A0A8H6N9F1_9PEZI|nr:integral membrane protein [Colletotrichum plurivorum]
MPIVNGVLTVLPAPEGYVVRFDNPQRRAVPEAFYVSGFGTFLSLLLMGQRLYTKAFLIGRLQLDDDMFAIGAGGEWTASIDANPLVVATNSVSGIHGWELPLEKFNKFMLAIYTAAPIYTASASFAKVSLLIFYRRLSPQRWFKWAIRVTVVIITLYSTGIFFALIFACDPIAMSWDVRVTEGTCINRPALYIATAVANIISDLILFCLPIPIVVRLQVPRRQKIGLFFIFAVGSLTVITSLVRVALLPALLTTTDPSWVISYASLWIIVEANLLVICAALPTLRRFLLHVAPRLIGASPRAPRDVAKKSGGSSKASRRTVGTLSGTQNRNDYMQFDSDSVAFAETFVMARIGESSNTVIETANNQEVARSDPELGKAIISGNMIVQTKTVTVEYSSNV